MSRRETGIRGEELARKFLENKGYSIQETNYRCPRGEIDIIARDGDTLVFVEVRTKSGTGFGSPEESITTTKMRHLAAAAAHYCQTLGDLPPSQRIDVVAIIFNHRKTQSRIEHIENAVSDKVDDLW